ncbi:MAG TPA: hypothetical protein VFQ39_04835, partial [Longimicrobium sp.]|nr:hypothetical protein [Longimicrobium sp.]
MRDTILGKTIVLAVLAPLALAACDAGKATAPSAAEPTPSASCQSTLTLDLAVGGTRTLSAEEAACFRLAPHAGARYALAAYDARAVEAARQGPETGLGADPVYSLGDGSSLSPIVLPSASRAADARPALDFTIRASSMAPEGDPFGRATPWTMGERFPIRRKDREETATARVVGVYDRIVFARVEGDAGSAGGKVIDDTEKALEVMRSQGFALLDRVFGDRRPSTSDGS